MVAPVNPGLAHTLPVAAGLLCQHQPSTNHRKLSESLSTTYTKQHANLIPGYSHFPAHIGPLNLICAKWGSTLLTLTGFNLRGARSCFASYLPLLFPRHRLRRRDDLLFLFARDVVLILGEPLFPPQVVTLSLQLMSNRYSFSMSHCSATSILAMTRRA